MPKLTMTYGLPASGKSTWARAQVVQSCGQTKRVNMDLLREMLDGGEFSKKNEKYMQSVRDQIIEDALTEGYNVVVDDTNLHPKHEEMLRALAARLRGVTFAIQDFTDVPVEECIRRDLLRPVSVGEKVIRQMHRRYLTITVEEAPPPPRVEGAPRAIIVDIDGTVAKMNGRSPYDYDRVDEDLPNTRVIQVVYDWFLQRRRYNNEGSKILFCSGRRGSDVCRERTLAWIRREMPWLYGHDFELFMRPEFEVDPKSGNQRLDNRKDSIVKKEIYEREILGKFNVDYVLDDRRQVVDMWREQGLLVLQVAPGDF